MKRRLSESERFFEELAQGLEVLGPAESAEVVTEVRGHLAEATAEAGGDEAAALHQFGSPRLLATRILQERGVLGEGGELHEAPAWQRYIAVALDAARWLILFGILLGWTLFGGVSAGSSTAPFVLVISWIYVAVVVGGTIWWWVWGRRRSRATAGMAAMGLRRVRLGESTKIIRERDIPGAAGGRPTRVALLAWALVLVLIFAWFSYGLASSARESSHSNQQQEIQLALQDSSQASLVVQNVYAGLTQGQDIKGWFASWVAADADQLVARYASYPFDYYLVTNVEMPDYQSVLSYEDPQGREIDSFVTVTEFHQGEMSSNYRYKVVYRVIDSQQSDNTGSISGQSLIEEVMPL